MLSRCCCEVFSSKGIRKSSWAIFVYLGDASKLWSSQPSSRFPFPCSFRFLENLDFAWEVCKKWQDGDVERACWEHLLLWGLLVYNAGYVDLILGPLKAISGASWGHLGRCEGHLGPLLRPMGAILDTSRSLLRSSWVCWSHLGPFSGHLGPLLGPSWPKRGNGKRDADCAEKQLFCTDVIILLSCKHVCIIFVPRQPGCKGPLYRFYPAAVSLASNPLFDLFLVLVDPWSRGHVVPRSHSCNNMLIAF